MHSLEKRDRIAIFVFALLVCGVGSSLQAQVNVSMPALTLKTGSDVQIPVKVSDLGNEKITSFEFVVVCDTTIIRFTGIEQTGTLSDGLMMFANTKVAPYGPGKMKVVCASARPLAGQGVLVYVKATVQSRQGSCPLQLMNFTLNAGTPIARITNGSAKLEGTSTNARRKSKTSKSGDTLAPTK